MKYIFGIGIVTGIMVFVGLGIYNSDNPMVLSQTDTRTSRYENIRSDELDTVLKQSPEAVVLDVRTAAEFESGHLPGALHIDFYAPDFARKLAGLDKTKTYLVYCRSGNRSSQTMDIMRGSGFHTVYNLTGGTLGLDGKRLCTGTC